MINAKPIALAKRLSGLALAGALACAAAARAEEAPALHVSGVGLNVTDIERSAKFYTEILGLKVALRVPAQGPTHELVLSVSGKVGEDPIVVLAKLDDKPLAAGRQGYGRIITNPADAMAIVRRAEAAGYKAHIHPSGPGGPIVAMVEDPDGYLVELYQRPAAAK